jgi:hypothetical protein
MLPGVAGRVIPPGLGRFPCIPPPPMAGRFCGIEGRDIPPMAGLPAFMEGRAPPPPPGRPPPPRPPRCARAVSHVPRMISIHARRTMDRSRNMGNLALLTGPEGVRRLGTKTAGRVACRVSQADPSASYEALNVTGLILSNHFGGSGTAAGFGPGVAAAGAGARRTITMSTISGATWPPMMRSIELVLTASLLTIV